LAEKVTLLQGDASDVAAARAGAIAQLANIVEGRAKFDELGQLAGYWFSPNRAGEGIALAGKVQSSSEEGKNFRMEVKLPEVGMNAGKVLTVLSAEKPDLKEGDSALILGVIVKDPAANLHRYEGQGDDTVIWAGAMRDLKE
jgi:hypothetical protein